jgi:glycosyltransferase 2 family protein
VATDRIDRRIVSRVGRLLTLAAIVFLLIKLYEHRTSIIVGFLDLESDSVIQLLGLALLFAALLAGKGFSWSYLLGQLVGDNYRMADGVAVHGSTQILKYLPGNVFHYAGRQLSADRHGWSQPDVAAASTIEAILNAASAVVVSAIALLLLPATFEATNLSGSVLFAAGAIIVVIVVVGLFRYLPRMTGGHLLVARFGDSVMRLLATRHVLAPLTMYVAFFALSGALLFVTTQILGVATQSPGLLFYIGAFPIAWIVGYITPGAPGGLGVREALLILFLSPDIGEAAAASAVITHRALTMVGEGVYFLVASQYSTRRR